MKWPLRTLGLLKNHPEPAWLSDDAREEEDGEGAREQESEKSSTHNSCEQGLVENKLEEKEEAD